MIFCLWDLDCCFGDDCIGIILALMPSHEMQRRENSLLRKRTRSFVKTGFEIQKWPKKIQEAIAYYLQMVPGETSRGFTSLLDHIPDGQGDREAKQASYGRYWLKSEKLFQERASLSSDHVGTQVSFKVRRHHSLKEKMHFFTNFVT